MWNIFASSFHFVLLCYYFWFINLFYASSYLVIPSQYNDFISKMILLLKDASRDKYLKHSNRIFLAFYCGLIGILFDKLHAFSIFCCYQWLILLYTEYLSNENYIWRRFYLSACNQLMIKEIFWVNLLIKIVKFLILYTYVFFV